MWVHYILLLIGHNDVYSDSVDSKENTNRQNVLDRADHLNLAFFASMVSAEQFMFCLSPQILVVVESLLSQESIYTVIHQHHSHHATIWLY